MSVFAPPQPWATLPSAMADALSYNRKQDYSTAEVAFIQRIVGSDADGQWGPQTVAAVERWQSANGIAADGKIWRSMRGNTWPPLLEIGAKAWVTGATGAPGISRVGLWTFSSAAKPGEHADAQLAQAKAAKLTDVSFTINNESNQEFEPAVELADIVEVGQRYKDAGIEVSVNAFIFPSATFVDALANFVLELHAKLGLRRADIDAEELWNRHGGQAAQDSAGELFGQRFADAGFDLSINGIVNTNHDALDALVRQAAVTHVTPQAYSTAGKGRVYNPIDLQAAAASKWGQWWPSKTMVGGFAAYKLAGTYELGELDETLSLGLSLRSWADAGVREVFGWSLAQLSDAAAQFIRAR